MYFNYVGMSAIEPGGIMIIVIGFLTVIFALAGLAGITSVIGFVVRKFEGVETYTKMPKVLAPETGIDGEDMATSDKDLSLHEQVVSDREIAVIAAAIYAAIKEPHRILNIRPVSTNWSREGRRSHFGSHRLR